MNVLILSNGHGEDAIGARLADCLNVAGGSRVHVAAFPLVGTGAAYRSEGIPVVGVQGELPSGGFARLGPRQFFGDLRAGLARLMGRQIGALRRLRGDVDAVVAVGDVLPLALGAWVARRPLAFHSTAKSDFIRPHLPVEITLMRRHCRRVYTRDERTARALRAKGVPAEFCGNIMMDMVTPPSEPLRLPASDGAAVVALLPGSRQDAYDNLVDMLHAVSALVESPPASPSGGAERWVFAVALASGLDVDSLEARAAAHGWELRSPPADRPPNEEGPGSGPFLAGRLVRNGVDVWLVRRGFSALLHQARMCIGTAGTANEQAVGLGIPVVAFPGRGGQFTPRFLAAQKRLLGDGLFVADRHPVAIADAVRRAAFDDTARERVRAAGEERMGGPGGAARMAASLLALWNIGP